MTYNVFGGTLNPAQPTHRAAYCTVLLSRQQCLFGPVKY